MTEIEFEGKTFRLSTDGFVPLSAFSRELFDLSPDDLGSFFDPEDRFYKRSENIRRGLHHNVVFSNFPSNEGIVIVCEGGIFCDDFEEFIRRARHAVTSNNQAFNQAIKQREEHFRNIGVSQKTSFFACRFARLLRLIAYLLRRVANAMR